MVVVRTKIARKGGYIHKDGVAVPAVNLSARRPTFAIGLVVLTFIAKGEEATCEPIRATMAKQPVAMGTGHASVGMEDGADGHKIRVAKGAENGEAMAL